MRTVYEKGLGALSVEELGRLLSQLGLAHFVIHLNGKNVSVLFYVSVLFCFQSLHIYHSRLLDQRR